MWTGADRAPASVAARSGARQVVLVGVPHLGLDDVGTGMMPTLDGLVQSGAAGATNVRTLSGRPSSGEAYATLGAGTRVRDGHAGLGTSSAEALDAMARSVETGGWVAVGAGAPPPTERKRHRQR